MGNTVAISQVDTHSYYKQAALILQNELKHYELLKHDTIPIQNSKVSFSFLAYSLNEHRLPVLVKIYLKPEYFFQRTANANNDTTTFADQFSTSRHLQSEIEDMKRDLISLNTMLSQVKLSIVPTQIYKDTDFFTITVRQYFYTSLHQWVNMNTTIKSTHIVDNNQYNQQLTTPYSTPSLSSPSCLQSIQSNQSTTIPSSLLSSSLQHISIPISPPPALPPKNSFFLQKTTHTEKKWLTYQLLTLVSQFHSLGMVHGDIKPANIVLTTSNWVFLTDFALHKPVSLNIHDPSQYFHHFASPHGDGGCYLAPERLIILDKVEFGVVQRRPLPTNTSIVPSIQHYASSSKSTTSNTSSSHHTCNSTSHLSRQKSEISDIQFISISDTPLYQYLDHVSEFHHQDHPISILGGCPRYPNTVDEGLEVRSNWNTKTDIFNSKTNAAMDIFSIGCVLYYIYTGEHLFTYTSLLSYTIRTPDSYPSDQLSLSKLPNLTLLTVISHMIQLDPSKRLNLQQYLSILTHKLTFFPSWFQVIRQFFFNIFCNTDFSTADAFVNVLRGKVPLLVKKILKTPPTLPYVYTTSIHTTPGGDGANGNDSISNGTNGGQNDQTNGLVSSNPHPQQNSVHTDISQRSATSTTVQVPNTYSAKERLRQMVHAKPFLQQKKELITNSSRPSDASSVAQNMHQTGTNNNIAMDTVGNGNTAQNDGNDQKLSINSTFTSHFSKNANTPLQTNQIAPNVNKHEIEQCCWGFIQQHHELSTQLLNNEAASFELQQYHKLQYYQQIKAANGGKLVYNLHHHENGPKNDKNEQKIDTNDTNEQNDDDSHPICNISSILPSTNHTYIPDKGDHPAILFFTPILAHIRHVSVSQTIGLVQLLSTLIDYLLDPTIFNANYTLTDITYHDFVLNTVKPLILTQVVPFLICVAQQSLSFYDPLLSTKMIKLSSDLSILTHPYYNFTQKYPLIETHVFPKSLTKNTLFVDPKSPPIGQINPINQSTPFSSQNTSQTQSSARFHNAQNAQNASFLPPLPVLVHTVHAPPLVSKTSETVLYQRPLANPTTPFSVPLVLSILHTLAKIVTTSLFPPVLPLVHSILTSFGHDISALQRGATNSQNYTPNASNASQNTNNTNNTNNTKKIKNIQNAELIPVMTHLHPSQHTFISNFFLQFSTVEDFYIINALILPLFTITIQHHSTPIVTTTISLLPKLVSQLKTLINTLYSQLTLTSNTVADFSTFSNALQGHLITYSNQLNTHITSSKTSNSIPPSNSSSNSPSIFSPSASSSFSSNITTLPTHNNPYDLSTSHQFHQVLFGLFHQEYRPIGITNPQNEHIKVLHQLHANLLESILTLFSSTVNTSANNPIIHSILQQTPLLSLIFGQKIQNTTLLPLVMSLFSAQSTASTKSFLFSYIHYYFSVFTTRQIIHPGVNSQWGQNGLINQKLAQNGQNGQNGHTFAPSSHPRMQTLVHLNSLNTFTQLLAPCFEQAFFDSNATVVFASLSSFLTIIKLTRLSALQHQIHLFDSNMQTYHDKMFPQKTSLHFVPEQHHQVDENGPNQPITSFLPDKNDPQKTKDGIFAQINGYSARIASLYEEYNVSLEEKQSRYFYTYQQHTQIYTTLFELLRQALIHLISPFKSIRLILLRIINTITAPLHYGPQISPTDFHGTSENIPDSTRSQVNNSAHPISPNLSSILPLKAHAYLYLSGTMSLFLASQYKPRLKIPQQKKNILSNSKKDPNSTQNMQNAHNIQGIQSPKPHSLSSTPSTNLLLPVISSVDMNTDTLSVTHTPALSRTNSTTSNPDPEQATINTAATSTTLNSITHLSQDIFSNNDDGSDGDYDDNENCEEENEQLELLRRTFLSFDTTLLPYLSLPPLSMHTYTMLKNGQLPPINEFDPTSPTLSTQWRVQQYNYYQQYNKMYFPQSYNASHNITTQYLADVDNSNRMTDKTTHNIPPGSKSNQSILSVPPTTPLPSSTALLQPTPSLYSHAPSIAPSISTIGTNVTLPTQSLTKNTSISSLPISSSMHQAQSTHSTPINPNTSSQPHIWIPETQNKEKLYQLLQTWSNSMQNRQHAEVALIQQHLQLQRQNLYEEVTQHLKQVYFSQVYVLQSILKQVSFQQRAFTEQFDKTKQKELLSQKEEEYRRQIAANIMRAAEQTQFNEESNNSTILGLNKGNNNDGAAFGPKKDTNVASRGIIMSNSSHNQMTLAELSMLGNNMIAIDKIEVPQSTDQSSGYNPSLQHYDTSFSSTAYNHKQTFYSKLLAERLEKMEQTGNNGNNGNNANSGQNGDNMTNKNEISLTPDVIDVIGQQYYIDGTSTHTLIDIMLNLTSSQRPNNTLQNSLTIPLPLIQQQILHQQFVNIRKQQQMQQYAASDQVYPTTLTQRAPSPFASQLQIPFIYVPYHIHPSLYLPFPRHLPIYSITDDAKSIFFNPIATIQQQHNFSTLTSQLASLLQSTNSTDKQYVFGIAPTGALNGATISSIQHDFHTALNPFVEIIDPANIIANVSTTSAVQALDNIPKGINKGDLKKQQMQRNIDLTLIDRFTTTTSQYTPILFQYKNGHQNYAMDDNYRLAFSLYTQNVLDRLLAPVSSSSSSISSQLAMNNNSYPFDLTTSLSSALTTSIIPPQTQIQLQQLIYSSQFIHILNPSSTIKIFNAFHLQSGQLALIQPHQHHQSKILSSPNTQFLSSPQLQQLIQAGTAVQSANTSKYQQNQSNAPIPFAVRSIPLQLLTILQWYHAFFAQNQPELTSYPFSFDESQGGPQNATSQAENGLNAETSLNYAQLKPSKTIVVEKSQALQAFLGTSGVNANLSVSNTGQNGQNSGPNSVTSPLSGAARGITGFNQPKTPGGYSGLSAFSSPRAFSTQQSFKSNRSNKNIPPDSTDNFEKGDKNEKNEKMVKMASISVPSPTDENEDKMVNFVQIPLTPQLITPHTLNQLHQFLLYLFYPLTHAISISPLSYLPSSSNSASLSSRRQTPHNMNALIDATNASVKQLGNTMLSDIGALLNKEVDFDFLPPSHQTNSTSSLSPSKQTLAQPYEDIFLSLMHSQSSEPSVNILNHNFIPPTVHLPPSLISSTTPPPFQSLSTQIDQNESSPSSSNKAINTTFSSMINTISMLYNYLTNTPVSTSTTVVLQPIDVMHALILSINPPLTSNNATDIHLYKSPTPFTTNSITPLPSSQFLDLGAKNDQNSLIHPLSQSTNSNDLIMYNPRYLGHLVHFILPLVNLWLQTTTMHPSSDVLSSLYSSILQNNIPRLTNRYNLSQLVYQLTTIPQQASNNPHYQPSAPIITSNVPTTPINHFLFCYNSLLSFYPQHVSTALRIDQNQLRSTASQYILVTRPQMLFFQQHLLYLNAHQRSTTLPFLFPLCTVQSYPSSSSNPSFADTGAPNGTSPTIATGTQTSQHLQYNATLSNEAYYSQDALRLAQEQRLQYHSVPYPYTPLQHLPHIIINPHNNSTMVLPQTLLREKKIVVMTTTTTGAMNSSSNNNNNGNTNVTYLDDIDNSTDGTLLNSSSSTPFNQKDGSGNDLHSGSLNRSQFVKNTSLHVAVNGANGANGNKAHSTSTIPTLLTDVVAQLKSLESLFPSTHTSFYLVKLATPALHPDKKIPYTQFNTKLVSQGLIEPFILPPPRPLTSQTTPLAKQGTMILNNAMVGGNYLVDPTAVFPPANSVSTTSQTQQHPISASKPVSLIQQTTNNRYSVQGSPLVASTIAPPIQNIPPVSSSDLKSSKMHSNSVHYPLKNENALGIGENTGSLDLVLPKQSHQPLPWYPKGQHCTTLTGHADTVTSLTVNDNNTLLASTSLDGSCRLYSTHHFGQSGFTIPLATLHAHPDTRTAMTQHNHPQPPQQPPKHTSVMTTSTFLNQTDQLVLGTSSVDSSAVLIYDLNQLTSQPSNYLPTTTPPPNVDQNTSNQTQTGQSMGQNDTNSGIPQSYPSGLLSRVNIPGHVVATNHATSLSHSLLLITNHHGGTFGWDPRMGKPVLSLQQPTMPHLTSSLTPAPTTHATLGPNPFSYLTGTSNGTIFLYDLRSTSLNHNMSSITNIWQAPQATAITHLSTMNSSSIFQSHPLSGRAQHANGGVSMNNFQNKSNSLNQNGSFDSANNFDLSHHSVHSPLICLGTLYTNELCMYDIYTGQTRVIFRTFDHNRERIYNDVGNNVLDNEERLLQLQQTQQNVENEGKNEQPLIALNYNTLMKYNGGTDLSYCYNTNTINNNTMDTTLMNGTTDLGYPYTLHNPLSGGIGLTPSLATSPYSRLIQSSPDTSSSSSMSSLNGIATGQQSWYQYKQDLLLSLYRGLSVQKQGHGITSVIASTQTGSLQTVPFVLTGGYDGFVRFWNIADPASSYHLCSPFWFGGNGYYQSALHQYQASNGYQFNGLTNGINGAGTLGSQFTNTSTNNQLPIETIRQYQRYLQLYTHTSLNPHINQIRIPHFSTRQLNIALQSSTSSSASNGVSDYYNTTLGSHSNAIDQMYNNMSHLHPSIHNIMNLSSSSSSSPLPQQTVLCFNEEQMLLQRDYIIDQHSHLHNHILSPIIKSKNALDEMNSSFITPSSASSSSSSSLTNHNTMGGNPSHPGTNGGGLGVGKSTKESLRFNEMMKSKHGQLYSALYPDYQQHFNSSMNPTFNQNNNNGGVNQNNNNGGGNPIYNDNYNNNHAHAHGANMNDEQHYTRNISGTIANNGTTMNNNNTNMSDDLYNDNNSSDNINNIRSQFSAMTKNSINNYYYNQYRSDQSIHNDYGHQINSITTQQTPSQRQHAHYYGSNHGITHLSMVDNIANQNKYFVASTITGDVNVWL